MRIEQTSVVISITTTYEELAELESALSHAVTLGNFAQTLNGQRLKDLRDLLYSTLPHNEL